MITISTMETCIRRTIIDAWITNGKRCVSCWMCSFDRTLPLFQALNLQSALAEEAKEKSRQVAGELIEWTLQRLPIDWRVYTLLMRRRMIDDLFSFWRSLMLMIGWDDRTNSAPLPSMFLDASLVGSSGENLTRAFLCFFLAKHYLNKSYQQRATRLNT